MSTVFGVPVKSWEVGSLLFLPLNYAACHWISTILPTPPVMTDIETLGYVLKQILPPVFLFQWFASGAMAAGRLPSNQQPYQKSPEGKEGMPSFLAVVERIMHNSFEQTVMTMGTCSALSLWLNNTTIYDARLPIAMGWVYIAGRCLFAAGYLKHPVLRIPGLWTNAVAALFCTLRVAGFADSGMLVGACATVVPVATISVIVRAAEHANTKKN